MLTSTPALSTLDEAKLKKQASRKRGWIANVRRAPLVPTLAIVVLGFVALFPDLLTSHSAYEPALSKRLLPPFWLEGGSWTFPLGTDSLGRDLLTRVIFATRVSLGISVAVLAISSMIGLVLALVSGYFGGRVDSIIMGITDSALSFPMILLALLLAATMGPSWYTTIIALSGTVWARYARVIRGEVMTLRNLDFIALARIAGCSPFRILLKHLFPNVVNTLVVMVTLQVGWVIISEASLSFLGAGVPPPTPTWGGMVAEGRQYVEKAWWIATLPGLAIMITVLAFNFFGDWLRDTLDPKLRQL